MEDETFADYILSEKDWGKKLEIMYYLKKRTNIFYDNTVIFKTLITRMFLNYLKANNPEVKVDDNLSKREKELYKELQDLQGSKKGESVWSRFKKSFQ